MFFIRWLGGLTTAQFIGLAAVLGTAVASGSGFAVVTLMERFGWRAAPLLLFVAIMATGTLVALVKKLQALTRRG